MKSESSPDVSLPALVVSRQFEELATSKPDDEIDLELCSEFERIIVTTRSSVYDVIVLAGDAGEVLIRGGRFVPEFQRAVVAGSVCRGSAVKLRRICVGLRLEFHVDGKWVVTSPIQAVSRHPLAVAKERA